MTEGVAGWRRVAIMGEARATSRLLQAEWAEIGLKAVQHGGHRTTATRGGRRGSRASRHQGIHSDRRACYPSLYSRGVRVELDGQK